MKFNLNKYLGVLRSVMIYYGKPFNKRKLKRFYRQFIQPDDLCFDIGAHLGNRSDAWISLGARVIAVEPQPACISFLKKKTGRESSILPHRKSSWQTKRQSCFTHQLTHAYCFHPCQCRLAEYDQ
jgi:hypothetical protein